VKRVALLIETSRSYGRELLRGVKRYAIEHGPWSLFVEVRDLESKPPAWLKSWDGDGILTRSGNNAIAAAVKRVGVPAVELRSTRRGFGLPFVGVDNEAVASLVVDHLLERGFRHFGVYGLDTEPFFTERRQHFVQKLQDRGFDCVSLRQSGMTERPHQWEKQQQRLIQWIESLNKPAGVLACTDQLGCWLLDACVRRAIRVPEELAVVGVENDETLATMSTPPLSSVQLPGERIGYEAARKLDVLMRGRKLSETSTLIAPTGIAVRQSSDVVAIDDPLLAQAIQWIRDHVCEGIRVADVLAAVPISRSSLERGCRRVLGRSPNAEIVRTRVDQVSRLLCESDLTLQQIADRTGFNTAQYLVGTFRQIRGITPGEFRRRHRVS
tara:strand:+ start:226903 stop:228051 length:1149 start_codon:yes stop_codon:yes gene_type:complete